MGMNASQGYCRNADFEVITVQEVFNRCDSEELADFVMMHYVDSAHTAAPLPDQRRQGIRLRLMEDIRDATSGELALSDGCDAVTEKDLSALGYASWEKSLRLPVIVPSGFADERFKPLAASLFWEMLGARE